MSTFKTIVLVVLLTTTCLSTQAQKVSNIDFDEIKTATQDSASAYFYPKLMAQFINQNIPLSDKQCTYLYYGSVFDMSYDPYIGLYDQHVLEKCLDARKYKDGLKAGMILFKKNPVNIELLQKMVLCYRGLRDKENQAKYLSMCFPLIKSLMSSGDGKSVETAYVVAKLGDEEALFDVLGLQPTLRESLDDTDIYVYTIEQTAGTEPGGEVNKIYVNTHQAMESMKNADVIWSTKPYEHLGETNK